MLRVLFSSTLNIAKRAETCLENVFCRIFINSSSFYFMAFAYTLKMINQELQKGFFSKTP